MTTATPERTRVKVAPALAGKPIPTPRTSYYDIVLEKTPYSMNPLIETLTGYRHAPLPDLLAAIRKGPGHKLGTIIGGHQAARLTRAIRTVDGDVSLRIRQLDTAIGEPAEPDTELASVTMLGCERFTENDAQLIIDLTGQNNTSGQLTRQINDAAWEIIAACERVPLAVATAVADTLRSRGYSNITVREAVPA